jgi:hypothetical protein
VGQSFAWLVQEFGPLGKPFAIAEMGEPAETVTLKQPAVTIAADPQSQSRVLSEVLDFCDTQRVAFAIWFVSRDYDALWDKISATSPEFFKLWKDCGLVDGPGAPRPAFQVWQEHLALPYGPRQTQ